MENATKKTGRRPVRRFVAKHRQTGEFVNVFAQWPGDRGGNWSLDGKTDIRDIITVLTNKGDYFFNVYENTETTKPGNGTVKTATAAEDLPF